MVDTERHAHDIDHECLGEMRQLQLVGVLLKIEAGHSCIAAASVDQLPILVLESAVGPLKLQHLSTGTQVRW